MASQKMFVMHVLGLLLAFGVFQSDAAATGESVPTTGSRAAALHLVLLPEDRIVVGTVEEVASDQVKVNTGEITPRYLSLKEGEEKKLRSLKKGDQLEIVVNAQNLVVDYHLLGQPGWHRIIRGSLAQPLIVGQEWAVIRTGKGKEAAYAVRPLARSKVAAIPVGAPAVFLVGEASQIMDAEFGSEETLRLATQGWHGSPPKAADRQIEGTIMRSITVTIRTDNGKERMFEVRPYVGDKLAKIPIGERVILLIDDEQKIADLALP